MKPIIVFPILLSLTACVTYPLPDAELRPKEACGNSKCTPGNNVGRVFNFTKNPYSPDISASTTPADIAFSVLGYTTKTKNKLGGLIRACGSDGSSPFQKSDIVPKISITGRAIDYTRNAKLNIDVAPTVSATLDELQKQFDISEYIAELEAKLEIGYKSIDKSDSTLKGTYYEWALSDSVINNFHTAKYKDCLDYLQANDRSLTTAVGFINFSTTVNSEDYSKFIADVSAVFTAKGLNFDVSPTINHEITKTLKASTDNGFQILVWRRAEPKVWLD